MKRVLDFVGLIDDDGRLSRTNLAVYLALASMVVSLVRNGTIDWAPLCGFIVAMVSYQAKRALLLRDKQADNTRMDQDRLAELNANDGVQKVLLDSHTTAIAQVASAVKNLTTSLKAARVV